LAKGRLPNPPLPPPPELPADPVMRKRYEEAMSDIMACVAREALRKERSQQWLADQLGVDVPRVVGHFRSATPQRATIDKYARLLRIPEEVINIKTRAGLSEKQLKKWWRYLILSLYSDASEFTHGTADEAERALNGLPDERRRQLIEAVVLAVQMGELPAGVRVEDWPERISLSSPGILVLSGFLPRTLDLRRRLIMPAADERKFWNIWLELAGPGSSEISDSLLSSHEVDEVIKQVAKFLRAKKINVEPMYEYYHHKLENLRKGISSTGAT